MGGGMGVFNLVEDYRICKAYPHYLNLLNKFGEEFETALGQCGIPVLCILLAFKTNLSQSCQSSANIL